MRVCPWIYPTKWEDGLTLDDQYREVVEVFGGELADVVDNSFLGGAGLADVDGFSRQSQALQVGQIPVIDIGIPPELLQRILGQAS